MALKVELSHPLAKAPMRGSAGAAGYDLFSCESVVIEKFGVQIVNIGIKIEIPENTYARIAPRSGMSLKGIAIGAGVVDYDYRGNIQVIFYNHSQTDYEINVGDKVAQLILEKIETPEVYIVQSLSTTERGDRGFGSTGR
jgi:dUTP pyrophosphatase